MSKQMGYSWLSPYLIVDNVETALKFYEKAFGFIKKQAVPGPEGNIVHAEMNYQEQIIMLGKVDNCNQNFRTPTQSGVPSPITLYIYCENVDSFYVDALAAGAKSLQPPEDTYWGDRMCSLQDPDGYQWNFATHTGKLDLAEAQI